MKSRVLESAVETYLRKKVESLGGECRKFLPDYARGYPDRIVVLPGGALVWVETKKPVGGKLSPAQKVAHLKLRRLGQKVEVAWTKADVDYIIQMYSSQGQG